jgi:hypothetical protein
VSESEIEFESTSDIKIGVQGRVLDERVDGILGVDEDALGWTLRKASRLVCPIFSLA